MCPSASVSGITLLNKKEIKGGGVVVVVVRAGVGGRREFKKKGYPDEEIRLGGNRVSRETRGHLCPEGRHSEIAGSNSCECHCRLSKCTPPTSECSRSSVAVSIGQSARVSVSQSVSHVGLTQLVFQNKCVKAEGCDALKVTGTSASVSQT